MRRLRSFRWPRYWGLYLLGLAVCASTVATVFPDAIAGPTPTFAGPARVIDGDTIVVSGRRVRLHGIDAPERDQTCIGADGIREPAGRRAAQSLRQLIGAQPVQCWGDTLDRYGRTIARCRVGDQDIEQALVRDGWALAYVRYSRDYMDEDIAARLAGRGMRAWRCETPSAYRRRT